jgi:cytochrome c peroxidase
VNAELGTTLHPQSDGDFTGARDATTLWGVGETAPYGWAGQLDSLDEFVVTTIHAHFVAGRAQPAERTAEQTAALVAYLRTLKPPITRFDQGPLSPAARRGEDLFQGKGGCIGCHTGPLLTDNALHNTLVPKVSPSDTDVGASGQAGSPLFGAFNTPHLRDLRNTAPYMHNGVFKTLEEVVEFYNSPRSSTGPLRLTPQETADLVAYLASL